MRAYSELYIEDGMECLGEFFDYMVNDCGFNIDETFEWFAYSVIGECFAFGHPKYVGGMTGVEMGMQLQERIFGNDSFCQPSWRFEKTKEYWCGWAIAQYQWEYNVSFQYLVDNGITGSWLASKYILHEADISKFYEVVNRKLAVERNSDFNALKRLRKYWKMTQKELSKQSGVSLRMIQLYEQGQNDISKASASVVISLAKTLQCKPEQLLEKKVQG